MEEYKVKILAVENVTHNVRQFTLERPEGYTFVPGQATEVAVNKPGWEKETRPFTFTGLTDSPHLEFTTKIYPERNGVTNELGKLNVGDSLLIHGVWGAISYKGEGIFIAAGAGVTPFIAILKDLYKQGELGKNKLIFSNKTSKDIILQEQFEKMLGQNFIKVVTEENIPGAYNKRIGKDYLKQVIDNFDQHFYVCGPDKFTEAVCVDLAALGAKPEALVFEK